MKRILLFLLLLTLTPAAQAALPAQKAEQMIRDIEAQHVNEEQRLQALTNAFLLAWQKAEQSKAIDDLLLVSELGKPFEKPLGKPIVNASILFFTGESWVLLGEQRQKLEDFQNAQRVLILARDYYGASVQICRVCSEIMLAQAQVNIGGITKKPEDFNAAMLTLPNVKDDPSLAQHDDLKFDVLHMLGVVNMEIGIQKGSQAELKAAIDYLKQAIALLPPENAAKRKELTSTIGMIDDLIASDLN